ncbi:hypothetical protein AD998_05610 [bacterium 336/3]|nr:hypothetical protein AD998_05610 [bacterium 336/3]
MDNFRDFLTHIKDIKFEYVLFGTSVILIRSGEMQIPGYVLRRDVFIDSIHNDYIILKNNDGLYITPLSNLTIIGFKENELKLSN